MPAMIATIAAPSLSAASKAGSHATIAATIEVPNPAFVPSMLSFIFLCFIMESLYERTCLGFHR